MAEWIAYKGTGVPQRSPQLSLPDPPPWRRFNGKAPDPRLSKSDLPPADSFRALTFQASSADIEMVNAALYLRRPLLVTGKPGVGKSSLAHSVARELNLGRVLNWPITSRSTLIDGLYRYDAVARLQDTSLARDQNKADAGEAGSALDVGQYVRLGPLGTSLVPQAYPRVLVIDELDKSDIDLPNDLLNIFEEGEFEIPELSRLRDRQPVVSAMTVDAGRTTQVEQGIVRCSAFPFIIITSNEEREFPLPFMRRCLTLRMQEPDAGKLSTIVEAHLGEDAASSCSWLIEAFLSRRESGELATDQLLNAVYLVHRGLEPAVQDRESLAQRLMPHLNLSS